MAVQVVSQAKDPHPFSRTGWQDVVTTSWAVLDMSREGTEVRWSSQVCGLETSTVRGVRTEFTDAFVGGLPIERWSGRLTEGAFAAGPNTMVFGAADQDLELSADEDGDGQPGVSVRVSHPLMGSGEVYVAQRATTSLSGELQQDGRIVGLVATVTKQHLFGASRWWLTHTLPQRAHPDAALSRFEMIPADAGTTCASAVWSETSPSTNQSS